MLCFLKMEKVKFLVCSPFGRNRIGIELKCQRRLLGWWTVIYISSDVTQKEKGEVGPAGTELLTKKQRERNSDKKRGILIATKENRTRNHEKEVRKSILSSHCSVLYCLKLAILKMAEIKERPLIWFCCPWLLSFFVVFLLVIWSSLCLCTHLVLNSNKWRRF